MKRSNKIVTKAIILFVMTWIMILGEVSSKRLTVYASTYYSGYLVTNSDTAQTLQEKVVRFNGMDWYIIADNSTAVDAGTVTLFAKDKIADSKFNNSCGSGNYYCSSAIKSFLDNLTSGNGSFGGVSYVIADTDLEDVYVTGAKLWLLSTSEAEALNSNARKCSSNWWLRSPSPLSSSDDLKKAMFVDGQNGGMPGGYSGLPYVDMSLGVRPALNLKLTDVTFNQETKTFIPLLPALNPIENKTYNGNAQEPTITFGSVNLSKDTDYTVSYEDSQGNVVTAPTNADTYTVTVTGIGNYSGTRTTSYTIEKECPTITAPIPNTLIYTGSAQNLVTAGQTSLGTIVYSLDGTSYSEAIPVGTDVGTYIVYYKVDEGEFWSAVEAQSVEAVISEVSADPQFKSHTLLLSGQIGINFYVDLSMLTEEEKAATVMEFTVNGKKTTDTFDVACTNPSTHTYYGFTCYINAAQMADEITAVLKYGENQTVSQTYSVAEYVSYVNEHSDGYSSNAIALVNAIADYGHYVQPFLETSNNWTLRTDHAVMSAHSVYTDSDVEAARTGVSEKAIIRDTGDSMVDKVTYSLSLESETTLNVYLKMKDGYTGTVTASIGGNAVEAVQQTDGRYRIQIKNISADDLSDTYVIEISAGGNFTVSVSALSYVNTVLNSDSDTFNNATAHYAVTSIYRYYVATMNYAEHPND